MVRWSTATASAAISGHRDRGNAHHFDAHAEHTMPEPVEDDSPEMSFRRGYQHGVIDVFRVIERLLDPATREVLKDWIEKDIYVWRTKAMLVARFNQFERI